VAKLTEGKLKPEKGVVVVEGNAGVVEFASVGKEKGVEVENDVGKENVVGKLNAGLEGSAVAPFPFSSLA